LWIGRILSALPILLMLLSASMKLMRQPLVLDQMAGKFGYPESTAVPIGLVELACVVVYLIPRTAVLGAALMTAYLGGAIATHVRVGDAFVPPLVLGVCAWAGIYLREERLRQLLPLRKPVRGQGSSP
jgi:hypothetical protein